MILTNTLTKLIIPALCRVNNVRLLSLNINKDVVLEKKRNTDTGIAVIGLNRPKQRNALSRNLITELENSLENIRNDSEVRVVIIRSLTPGIFCAGK